jgi:hypothetical protein
MAKMTLKKRASRNKEIAFEMEKHAAAEREATKSQLDNPLVVIQHINHYRAQQVAAQSRKTRQEELMQRPASKKWDAAKKAKMVRRLVRANQELEQSLSYVGQLESKLEQLMNNVSSSAAGA